MHPGCGTIVLVYPQFLHEATGLGGSLGRIGFGHPGFDELMTVFDYPMTKFPFPTTSFSRPLTALEDPSI